MTIDPDLLSLIKWACTGFGTILTAGIALASKGLSAILSMQKETVQACTNQANSNEKVAKAIEALPCVKLHSSSEVAGLLREVRISPAAGGRG